ncbi:MAG: hypothetical protein Q7T83_07195 [Thermodesulfovibrionales bacterium]|nr:hypothetical protein [Thermodesulfovibrionales bacterium]
MKNKALIKMGSVPGFTIILIFAIAILMCQGLYGPKEAQAKEVQFTLEDRDRLIRLEAKLDGQDKRFEGIDKRFEQIDKRIERLETVMMGGFGLLFTSMIGLVGFVLWDRRTALAPAIRKNKELEEREDRLEKALKEYAMEEPRLKEILKHAGLL